MEMKRGLISVLIFSVLIISMSFVSAASPCPSEKQMQNRAHFIVEGEVEDVEQRDVSINNYNKDYVAKINIDSISLGNFLNPNKSVESDFFSGYKRHEKEKYFGMFEDFKKQGYVLVGSPGSLRHNYASFVPGEKVRVYLDEKPYYGDGPAKLGTLEGHCGKIVLESSSFFQKFLYSNSTYMFLIPLIITGAISFFYFRKRPNKEKNKTSVFSIISFVLSLVFPIITILLVNLSAFSVIYFLPVIFILAIVSLINLYKKPELKGSWFSIISIFISLLGILFVLGHIGINFYSVFF